MNIETTRLEERALHNPNYREKDIKVSNKKFNINFEGENSFCSLNRSPINISFNRLHMLDKWLDPDDDYEDAEGEEFYDCPEAPELDPDDILDLAISRIERRVLFN